jgi:hypothetical protein
MQEDIPSQRKESGYRLQRKGLLESRPSSSQ